MTCKTRIRRIKCIEMLDHLPVHVKAAYTCSKHYTCECHVAHANVPIYFRCTRESKKILVLHLPRSDPENPSFQQPYLPNELCRFVAGQCQIIHIGNSTRRSGSSKLPSSRIHIFQSNWSEPVCTSYTNSVSLIITMTTHVMCHMTNIE